MINTSTINITLTDANDNRPIFSGAPYLVTIPEGTRGPQVVLTVVATDEDSSTNGQIEYFTAGGTVGDFRIDTNTVSTSMLSYKIYVVNDKGNIWLIANCDNIYCTLEGICMQDPPYLLAAPDPGKPR